MHCGLSFWSFKNLRGSFVEDSVKMLSSKSGVDWAKTMGGDSLISFTNEMMKNRVMDFRISANSRCTNISPQLGQQFRESCTVIALTDGLLLIFFLSFKLSTIASTPSLGPLAHKANWGCLFMFIFYALEGRFLNINNNKYKSVLAGLPTRPLKKITQNIISWWALWVPALYYSDHLAAHCHFYIYVANLLLKTSNRAAEQQHRLKHKVSP